MHNRITQSIACAALAAGAAGLGLEAAGERSPLRAVLVLLFLAVAPTAAAAGLLRGFDPLPRLILASSVTVTILTVTGIVMLLAGVWSPTGGLAAVAAITAAGLAAQSPAVRRSHI